MMDLSGRSLMAERCTGSARRRREWRLRAQWRHEQRTVAVALAAATHHGAQRGERRDLHEATGTEDRQCRGHVRCSTEPDDECCARKNSGARGLTGFTRSGRRNGFSGAPWNRTSTTRSSCRRLTFQCRRWKTSWWRYAGSSISSIPSRLSKCPRSPFPVILAGAVCVSLRRRQNSWWKFRRSYPTLRCTGLWSRTWSFQFLMIVIASVVVFSVYTRQSSGAEHFPAATAEQIVHIPVPRGGRVLHPASSSFSHFSLREKVRRWVRIWGRNCADFTSSTPAAQLEDSSRTQLVCGCSFQVVGGNFWARTQKSGGLGEGWDGALVMRQPTTTFGRISSCFPVLCARAVRTWNLVHNFLCLCFWQLLFRASGYRWEGYGNLDFSGDVYFRWCNALYNSGYMLCVSSLVALDVFHTFSTLRRARILKRFFSIRFEWRSVHSRCFRLQLCFAWFALENT